MKKVDNKKNYNIVLIDNTEEIREKIEKFNKVFNPNLSERVSDMEAYAEKLYQNAIVISVNDEEECIGFAAFYANDTVTHTAYLTQIAVSPEKQNMHIGEMLLNRCIDISNENGMKTMKLEVQNDNYHAIRFYENHDFNFCGNAIGNSRYMNREI